MAVCRGGIAFWAGCVRGNGNRQPIKKQHCSLTQAVVWQWVGQTRPLNSTSWALAPPNSLRYERAKQPALSHPLQDAGLPRKASYLEEEWEDSLSVCMVLRPQEPGARPTLVEIPLFGQAKLGELLALRAHRPAELPFLLTTVDGSREDDINIGTRAGPGYPTRTGSAAVAAVAEREHRSFRHLFQAEGCPAPFVHGSLFYCFHCPVTEPLTSKGVDRLRATGLESKPLQVPLSLSTFLCSLAEGPRGDTDGRESEKEEKLALMYERLQMELPHFFIKSHDYSMYSNDVEFINGLINTHTRGRLAYQLALSTWRLLCLCYYAEARWEVLKLTKHPEDGTIKARWRIKGLPFHRLWLRFYRKDKSLLYRSFDAFSTFYVGQDGLIQCHKVEKVMQAPPPLLPRVTSLVAGALVALGVEEHRPALNLLPLFFSSLRQGRN